MAFGGAVGKGGNAGGIKLARGKDKNYKRRNPCIALFFEYAHDGDLEKDAELALEQIEKRRYDVKLRENGVEKILKYGIACYKKRCRIVLREGNTQYYQA